MSIYVLTTLSILVAGLAVGLLLARDVVVTLAIKYLFKRRLAWVSLAAVALCSAMVLVVISVMGGWLEMFKNSFRALSGELIISRPSMGGFAGYEEIVARAQSLEEVAAAVPVIRTFGLIQIGQLRDYVGVVGLPIDRIDQVMDFSATLWLHRQQPVLDKQPEPRAASFNLWPDLNYRELAPSDRLAERRPGMILGSGVIGVRRDDTGRLLWPSQLRELRARLTVVPNTQDVGAAGSVPVTPNVYWIVDGSRTQLPQHDKNVYVPFDQLQRDLQMSEDRSQVDVRTNEPIVIPSRTTEIQVKLKPGADVNSARDKIEQIVADVSGDTGASFDSIRVQTWQDQQAIFLRAIEKEIALTTTLFGFISVVAVFLIFCIFYMIVVEKTRDIGILKSVGASAWNVALIFLAYGAAIGIAGGAIGVALGWVFVQNINAIHTALGSPIWSADVYAFDFIPDKVNPEAASIILAAAIVSAVVGAVVPALRAARLRPVEALRFE